MAAGPAVAVLDNRRVPCALGLILLRQTMDRMAPGEEVIVLSRDRFAPIEIPLWAERAGHQVLTVERVGVWPVRCHQIRLRAAGTHPAPQRARRTVDPVLTFTHKVMYK